MRLAEVAKKPQQRDAAVSAIDLEARTVEIAFSSDTESVERWFGIEVLGHAPGEVRMGRLQNNGPVLWMHDQTDQRGVIESARIDADAKGRAVIRLSKSAAGDQLFQDIADGITTHVSVGYNVFGMRLVEERDGIDVYRVTDWEPYEISLVSVPADTTVGVGRSLTEPQTRNQNSFQATANHMKNQLAAQIVAATRAMGFHDHVAVGFDTPHARTATPAVAAGSYKLSDLLPRLPVSAAEHAAYVGPIDARKSARDTSVSASILENSHVAKAGAHLILVSPEANFVPGTDGQILYAREGNLRMVKAAPFANVVDGQDVATSAYPAAVGHYALANAPSSAVHFQVSRRDQKNIDGELLAYEILQSLSLGLAKEFDRILLTAIAAKAPAAFSFGAVAAKALKFGDLSAIVGTAGTGAAVNAVGIFNAAGVPAEMTDCVAPTFVGAFASAGVAILDDIHVLIKRNDARGNLDVTVYVNAVPAFADPAMFWKVA